MAFLNEWLVIVAVFGVVLIAPGPNFLMAIRNSIVYSRKAGLFTAIGFGLGVCVHVFYAIAGIAALVAQSIMLFTVIKFIGAGYLFYIGYKALRSKGFKVDDTTDDISDRAADNIKNTAGMSAMQALRSGFVTNLFNPKATMFFLALFTQIVDLDTPLPAKVSFGGTCVAMVIIWYSFVVFVLTNPHIKHRFLRFTKWIDKVSGALFIALGLKLVISKA